MDNLKPGSCLHHGEKHEEMHRTWSRRHFLSALGSMAGGTVMVGNLPVRAAGAPSLLSMLSQMDSERILVLVQLEGGNDGLNTLVPVNNDIYYRMRPQISVPAPSTHYLNDELGFHPQMEALTPLWNEGDMHIIQGVGYPEQDLSHFRSTDIWLTASDTREYLNTGWVGRSSAVFRDQIGALPEYPLAVQLGWGSPLLLKGDSRSGGMSITNPDLFRRLAESGRFYDEKAVADAPFGKEIEFMRTVANDSFRYAEAIQQASEKGQNQVAYPDDNEFAQNLSIVAQLISGNLGARIYHVVLQGFDTHADQADWHGTLLRYFSEGVAAFQQDMEKSGRQEDVLVMTFSEFGRRVEQNGSFGTDHGSAAPLFLFGKGIEGGMTGQMPDLAAVDEDGNLPFQYNFRQVYATMLTEWFGFSNDITSNLLGDSFETLEVISRPQATYVTENREHELRVTAFPNPFTDIATIQYDVTSPGILSVEVYDVAGRRIKTLFRGHRNRGRYEDRLEAEGLPGGVYFCRIQTESGEAHTQKLVLVR